MVFNAICWLMGLRGQVRWSHTLGVTRDTYLSSTTRTCVLRRSSSDKSLAFSCSSPMLIDRESEFALFRPFLAGDVGVSGPLYSETEYSD